ncbi:uncharacterized protein LOC130645741 [Hydractinia symbiolongicarpus]|uniref:uncharacterized protein LOC130645741 n=1 Tax=Hydractinia symbiolongicarpus TaxID=13093 RepID=UPI00255170FC|nr:uncharacterized protein LOC130645741 [Hydractinia symbiolongicarpus]
MEMNSLVIQFLELSLCCKTRLEKHIIMLLAIHSKQLCLMLFRKKLTTCNVSIMAGFYGLHPFSSFWQHRLLSLNSTKSVAVNCPDKDLAAKIRVEHQLRRECKFFPVDHFVNEVYRQLRGNCPTT